MTQNIHTPENSILFIFCDQPDSPADMSVSSFYVHPAARIINVLSLNRGPSYAKFIKMVTTEIKKNHIVRTSTIPCLNVFFSLLICNSVVI